VSDSFVSAFTSVAAAQLLPSYELAWHHFRMVSSKRNVQSIPETWYGDDVLRMSRVGLQFGALPADNYMQLPIFETVRNGINIVGSIVGTRLDLAEVLELHADGRTKVINETRHLEDVNHAFEEVEKGTVPARLVFDMK